MSDAASQVVDLYRRHAKTCAATRGTTAGEASWVARFASMPAADVTVLDIGCGSGRPIASHLAAEGHSVTGIDSSPAMVELFRPNVPDAEAIVADMRLAGPALAGPARKFGASPGTGIFTLCPTSSA